MKTRERERERERAKLFFRDWIGTGYSSSSIPINFAHDPFKNSLLPSPSFSKPRLSITSFSSLHEPQGRNWRDPPRFVLYIVISANDSPWFSPNILRYPSTILFWIILPNQTLLPLLVWYGMARAFSVSQSRRPPYLLKRARPTWLLWGGRTEEEKVIVTTQQQLIA